MADYNSTSFLCSATEWNIQSPVSSKVPGKEVKGGVGNSVSEAFLVSSWGWKLLISTFPKVLSENITLEEEEDEWIKGK